MARRKGIHSKRKGNRAERVVAKMFAEWWGAEFARTPSSGGFKTKKFREDWNAEGDLVTPDESFPFSVECKWAEGWTLDQLLTADKCLVWEWWAQCIGQTPEDKIPLLVFKRNHMPWFYMTFSILPMDRNVWVPGRKLCTNPPIDHPGYPSEVSIGLLDDLFTTKKEEWLDE